VAALLQLAADEPRPHVSRHRAAGRALNLPATGSAVQACNGSFHAVCRLV
jgi:hypothetical protein